MNQDKFNAYLAKSRDTSGIEGKIMSKLMHFMKISCDEISKYHDTWSISDDIYRGYRVLDRKDEDAIKKKQPPKIILPISYAMTQTALSFLMSTFFADNRIFRLRGNGAEDQRVKDAYELDLAYQTTKQKAYYKFYLWFQDAFKYGVGIIEDCWEERYEHFRVQEKVLQEPGLIQSLLGSSPVEVIVESVKKLKTFEGTTLRNISPYSFYPDPGVPMAEFQDGQFVATEDETTRAELISKEGSVYYGTNHIPDTFPSEIYNQRKHRVGSTHMFKANLKSNFMDFKLGGAALKTRIEFKTTKRELAKEFDYDLDKIYDKDSTLTMLAVIANDQKLIKFEPLGYLHNKFSYNVIEYSPDHNTYSNPGLGETIYDAQEAMTWYYNAHVTNVRKNIKNRLVVNPEFIEVADLENGREVIRAKKNIQGRDIRDFIYSLELNDITRGHIQDMQVLNGLMQIITGINENTLGQYSQGRRSAAQTQQVTGASGARLKTHGKLFYSMGVEPLAQKMISNTNQLRSEEFWNNILGEEAEKYPYNETILFDPAKVITGFDFIPYEGTMPNEKENQARLWNDFLGVMFSNPEAVMQLTGANLNKILEHYFDLQGIKNAEDFFNNPAQAQANATPPEVVPDEQVLENMQNLQPL